MLALAVIAGMTIDLQKIWKSVFPCDFVGFMMYLGIEHSSCFQYYACYLLELRNSVHNGDTSLLL
jgi:hypothetical protein